MIALDTNIIIYAHRKDSPHHKKSLDALKELSQQPSTWCIPWPCLHEFLAITTHPRIYSPPSTGDEALTAIQDLLNMTNLVVLSENSEHFATLSKLITRSGIRGPRIHDARIAAICLSHGVRELWTADRDFSFFPDVTTYNPLVDKQK